MSPLPPDPYKILGVAKDVEVAEIRSAYRKLVLKCHPDKVQDPELKQKAQDEFHKLQQAYELLNDENKRAKYDDQVEYAELKRKKAARANTSSPRTSPIYSNEEYEIHTVTPRSSTFPNIKVTPGSKTKVYTTYSKSYEEDYPQGARIYETEIRTSSRRGTTYETTSKRDSDRTKSRDSRSERERERRKEEERARKKQEEKIQKEAAKEERRQRDKQRTKDIRSDRKQHEAYVEAYPSDEEEILYGRSDRKKSSRSDERRERTVHQDEMPLPRSFTSPANEKLDFVQSYISRSRGVELPRAKTYHAGTRTDLPPAPMAPSAADEDDVRRSQARPRRDSTDTVQSSRSHRRPSRDFDETAYMSGSPSTRHPPTFISASTPLSESPPRLNRHNSMPAESSYAPAAPPLGRAQTFNDHGYSYVEPGSVRGGRTRSRYASQIPEEMTPSEEDEIVIEERRHKEHKDKDRKSHRSGRREERDRVETSTRYAVNGDGRSTTQQSAHSRVYSRDGASYYPARSGGSSSRNPEYASSYRPTGSYKVATSKSYDLEDIAYTQHQYAGYAQG